MSVTNQVAQHIVARLQSTNQRPLFVGLQGPQGSGKSYTSKLLQNHLSSPPFNLRTAILSIDDFYLPHATLRSLAESNPENRLLCGRGQPGTHDIDLGTRILTILKEGRSDVELPLFEKSLHNGEGDRLPMDGTGVIIRQPPCLDVIILEGWFVGFYPISVEELEKRWRDDWAKESATLGIRELASLDNIAQINEKLREYVKLWDLLDTLVQLEAKVKLTPEFPSQYSIIYKWRLEQEHNMKSRNGGAGMSDEAVKAFIDRYIPGYVFFGNGLTESTTRVKWAGKHLRIFLGEGREVVDSSNS
ncbi:hypothetical protein AX15_006841 [Amanita polypyramis BW_CC]|nr:hypothetical protein AX15_006841 [Amanita polypyramis BW_CC]